MDIVLFIIMIATPPMSEGRGEARGERGEGDGGGFWGFFLVCKKKSPCGVEF